MEGSTAIGINQLAPWWKDITLLWRNWNQFGRENQVQNNHVLKFMSGENQPIINCLQFHKVIFPLFPPLHRVDVTPNISILVKSILMDAKKAKHQPLKPLDTLPEQQLSLFWQHR